MLDTLKKKITVYPCATPKTHAHVTDLTASLSGASPTVELYWSIQLIHPPTLFLHLLPLFCLQPPPAQIPPGAAASISEPPEPVLSPLTVVTSRVSRGHSHDTPDLPCCQSDFNAMKPPHENTRAFMLYRQRTYSQRGIISPPVSICNITFSSSAHQEKVIHSSIKFIISYYICTKDLEKCIVSHQMVENRRDSCHWTANFHMKWMNYIYIIQGKFTGWCTTSP